jgi:hypothetical protein
MLCSQCEYYTNGGCDKPPSKMDDTVCLLRHVCIQLNNIVNKELEEDSNE